MPTQDEPLPVYCESAPPPPCYTQERAPAQGDLPRYTFSWGALRLDLGPKTWRTPLPCYGKNDPVEGSVTVSSRLSRVTRVEVKLEARVLCMLSERGLPAGHTQLTLFTESKVLHDRVSDLDAGTTFPFELLMPETVEVEGSPYELPPTAKWYHPGKSVEVTYHVTIDLSRKGLGRHEKRVETEIFYLPRTRSVKVLPLSWGLSPSDCKRSEIDMTNWKVIPLNPTWRKGVESGPSPYTAQLSLPSCFISGWPPLSFHVHIERDPSYTGPAPDLSTLSVLVQLVRQVSITVNDQRNVSESVVGQPMIFVERSSPSSREIFGKIGWGSDGQECSWNIGRVVQVMHAARVEIRPPAGMEGKAPAFVHRQRVWMHTDDWADDAPEREGPALGLLRNGLLGR